MRSVFVLVPCAASITLQCAGCQLFVDSEVGAGLGAPCQVDDDCQGAKCIDDVCAAECSSAADCPEPSQCMSNGLCQLPLRVGFVYVGDPDLEQWTEAHELGRTEAAAALPFLQSEIAPKMLLASDAASAMDDYIARGFEVVVANSSNLTDVVSAKAAEHPDVKFLTCGGLTTSENHASYYGSMYQATYLAGYAAARRSASKRLGMVGSYVTPAVIRHINAFTTGARRADPAAVVEVRWVYFWHDTDPPDPQGKSKERVLTEQLMATGCDVIAHQADNGAPVATVADAGTAVKAIGNNVKVSCPDGSPSCLGATYWRWGPLYTQLFNDIHRSRFPSGEYISPSIQVSEADSVVNFRLNAAVGTANLALEVSDLLEKLTADGSLPFRGPLCSTGQRDTDGDGAPDCVEEGAVVSEGELRSMCWFVEGVIEKEDPASPASADRPAQVPASGDCVP